MENLTAKVSCFARAYHYRHHPARIFADAAAEPLLGGDYERIAQSMAQGVGFFIPGFEGSAEEALRLIVDGQLSPSVLGRSAYCEAALAREKRLGCRQYAIFACGYDTFSIRNHDPSLRVFELDLPEMLADRRARMARAGLEANAVCVPCDLSEPSWADRLLESGFDRGAKSFASLLGISYYLDAGAFSRLLTALGGLLCEGSAICFDYPTTDGSRQTHAHRQLARGADEPMKAQYDERELEALLEKCGFLVYEHLDHSELTRRYFAEHNRLCPDRAMEAPKGVCCVHAVRK